MTKTVRATALVHWFVTGVACACAAEVTAPAGWRTAAPREAIRPAFHYDPAGGRDGRAAMIIEHDDRAGLDGFWTKSFAIEGGNYYRLVAYRRLSGVTTPRRSALVRLLWRDDQGNVVDNDHPVVAGSRPGWSAKARAEHPTDRDTDSAGWTKVAGTYRAPKTATQAVVELHLQWAPHGKVWWSDVSLSATEPPPPRMVRLAAVHHRPPGPTPRANRESFVPLVEEAARQQADLVVLPETVNYYATDQTPAHVAEPIPGPSSKFFATLARRHKLHIVVGLYERAEHLVYNSAVLLDEQGRHVGTYRKVSLPRDEVAAGVAAGIQYPVFETDFGRLGMMICYDGFFPEVAGQLARNGAEVIAFPVWGANPDAIAARAIDNQVYVVSSTYADVSEDWMVSAVFDHTGKSVVQSDKWGSVSVAEVDLNQPTHWKSLGDMKSQLRRHQPPLPDE